jgi:hypothetical protein
MWFYDSGITGGDSCLRKGVLEGEKSAVLAELSLRFSSSESRAYRIETFFLSACPL